MLQQDHVKQFKGLTDGLKLKNDAKNLIITLASNIQDDMEAKAID